MVLNTELTRMLGIKVGGQRGVQSYQNAMAQLGAIPSFAPVLC